VVFEPVAYDKRIEMVEDGYIPIIRMDGDEIALSAQRELYRAQQVLDCFEPDVWEGVDVPWSFNCYPDLRCMNA